MGKPSCGAVIVADEWAMTCERDRGHADPRRAIGSLPVQPAHYARATTPPGVAIEIYWKDAE